jgi:hypothetical protein
MNRTLLSGRLCSRSAQLVVCAAVAACVLAATVGAWAADDGKFPLPLKRVVMFSSGVGFFQHFGQVEGDAKVEMRFNVRDINDLLKSMVVMDFDGGTVSTVTYGSKDPITKTLKSFVIDLTTNPTLAQLLGQVRGEKVEIEAPAKITGVILGVETRRKKVGENEFIDIHMLNLVTDEGLRSIPLDTVSRIKLANPQLDAELNKALATLASALATDKKTVSVSFLGKGKRSVQIGYIHETPVWKTTYRLVLSDDEKKPLVLQGWAIVENTTETDWTDVALTLVSGRPISFIMDLYQPLYVPRPEERLELFASLRPQTYGQDLAAREAEFLAKRDEARQVAAAPPGALAAQGMRARAADKAFKGESAVERAAPAADGMALMEKADLDIRRGVQSVAQARDVGNFFQYEIGTPVTLPRQQSAMLPIVNEEVQGTRVSIYNPRVQPKHPLAGLRFTNTTKVHLMQGPITVFDGGVYAGDAKIEDLPPKSTRLISYALDLETEVAPLSKSEPDQLVSVKIFKGVLHAMRKYTRAQEYTVKNSGRRAKTVLIEQPLDPNWTLVSPKEPAEKTRDMYRFTVEAKPGEPAKLVVQEERIESQQIAILNLDDNSIRIYISSPVVSQKVKDALQEVIKRKHELALLVAERQRLEQRIREIDQDQARIRQNMAQLDRNSELYKSYVADFTAQEVEIKKLRAQIAALVDKEAGARKALDEYLMGLNLD